MFAEEIPEPVVQHLLQTAKARDGDVLAGMFTIEPPLPGQDEPRYYNTVVSLGSHPPQLYRKRHLVPFGEIIPLEPVFGWFIRAILAIPLASQTPGAAAQPPFAIVGQRVAVDICYEDAFGSDIRSQAVTATLLINVTNDAWYGHSSLPSSTTRWRPARVEAVRPFCCGDQYRYPSVIGHDGRELARLPCSRAEFELEITGRQGATPYLRGATRSVSSPRALLRPSSACDLAIRSTALRRQRGGAGKIDFTLTAPRRMPCASFSAGDPHASGLLDRQGCALLQPTTWKLVPVLRTPRHSCAPLVPSHGVPHTFNLRGSRKMAASAKTRWMQHYYQYQIVTKPRHRIFSMLYLGRSKHSAQP
jgi:hypothetical protein